MVTGNQFNTEVAVHWPLLWHLQMQTLGNFYRPEHCRLTRLSFVFRPSIKQVTADEFVKTLTVKDVALIYLHNGDIPVCLSVYYISLVVLTS